jgi:hypothetical protein
MFAGQRAAEDWMTRCHGCYITLFERKKAADIAGTMGRTQFATSARAGGRPISL